MKQFHHQNLLHLGGVDWAEDISSWATGGSSIIRQVSFIKIARVETYCLSLMEASLTEATQAFQGRGCREVLQHSSVSKENPGCRLKLSDQRPCTFYGPLELTPRGLLSPGGTGRREAELSRRGAHSERPWASAGNRAGSAPSQAYGLGGVSLNFPDFSF